MTRAIAIAIAILVAAVRAAAADPELAVTARVGAAHFVMNSPQEDSDTVGDGLTVGAQIGAYFRALHLEPAIGVDLARFDGSGFDGFTGDFTLRISLVSVSARLRAEVTPWLDVTASAGPSLVVYTFPKDPTDTNRGWHYEIAVGVRVWHCAHQALRVELAARSTTYDIPDDPVTTTQLGASVAYAFTF